MRAAIIEKIEDYLNGDINLTDLRAYAEQQNVTDLEDKIAWVKDVALAVEAEGVKAQIGNLLADNKSQPAKVVTMPMSRWIIGLAASLMLVVTAYFGLKDQSPDDHQQYAQYEYNDPGLPVVMSQSSNYALYDALTYYGEQNYTTAVEKLLALPSTSSDTVAYYLGASYLYQEQYKKAIAQLPSVAKNSSSVFQEKAQWLLILSYLKGGDTQSAKVVLDEILSDSEHQFYQKAAKLQKEI